MNHVVDENGLLRGCPKGRMDFLRELDFWGSKNPTFWSLYTAMARWAGEGDARILLSTPRNPRIESFRAVEGHLAAEL